MGFNLLVNKQATCKFRFSNWILNSGATVLGKVGRACKLWLSLLADTCDGYSTVGPQLSPEIHVRSSAWVASALHIIRIETTNVNPTLLWNANANANASVCIRLECCYCQQGCNYTHTEFSILSNQSRLLARFLATTDLLAADRSDCLCVRLSVNCSKRLWTYWTSSRGALLVEKLVKLDW